MHISRLLLLRVALTVALIVALFYELAHLAHGQSAAVYIASFALVLAIWWASTVVAFLRSTDKGKFLRGYIPPEA